MSLQVSPQAKNSDVQLLAVQAIVVVFVLAFCNNTNRDNCNDNKNDSNKNNNSGIHSKR